MIRTVCGKNASVLLRKRSVRVAECFVRESVTKDDITNARMRSGELMGCMACITGSEVICDQRPEYMARQEDDNS